VIGGGGEKRTLRSVARKAEHWNFPGGGVEVLKTKKAVLEKHCADLGRNVDEITISTHVRYNGDDYGPLLDEVAALGENGLDLAVVYLQPPHTAAMVEALANALSR
jgi:hypothetical protein